VLPHGKIKLLGMHYLKKNQKHESVVVVFFKAKAKPKSKSEQMLSRVWPAICIPYRAKNLKTWQLKRKGVLLISYYHFPVIIIVVEPKG